MIFLNVKQHVIWLRWFILASCLTSATLAFAQPVSWQLSGNIFEYTVQAGDSLAKISARYGVSSTVLARENGLKPNAALTPEQKLQIDNRHIVPDALGADLLINLPQRMLYFYQDGQLKLTFPVALGKPTWPTPTGEFTVKNKIANKTWIVPISIQEEMRREGKAVKTHVPPGPNNPLGKYWLGLSLSGIGIHGTTAPASIYRFQSHGCIRLHPDDIEVLFNQIEPEATGNIIYAPLLLAESEGRIFIEAHQNIYKNQRAYQKLDVSLKSLEQWANDAMLTERIDWERAKQVLEQRDGIARDVTREY
ncbi:MAG TPA: L,D-transpeptidase family protein [Methylotenera sp.]|nr:L,D-transpeptidase family protein [Methylotenera sp.]